MSVGGLEIETNCGNSDNGPTIISIHAAHLNVYYDGVETTVWKQVPGYDTTSSVFLLLIFVAALIAWVPRSALPRPARPRSNPPKGPVGSPRR